MRHIPVIFAVLLAGCVTNNLERLSAEAKECVRQEAIANSVTSDDGVVVDATAEQRTGCWADWNEKSDVMFKISERKRKEREYELYWIAVCAPYQPVFEIWGIRDKRFKGCWDPRFR